MTRRRRVLLGLGGLVAALFAARGGCMIASRIPTRQVEIPNESIVEDGSIRRFGKSWMRKRGSIFEVSLEGDSGARGAAVSRLLRKEMVEDESALYNAFKQGVPFAPARWAIMDLGRWQFRKVEQGIPDAYRDEVAGIALGFQPDPFTSILPSYHRFVFLYAVYDIALSFEKSPLIGCTTFTIPPVPDSPHLLQKQITPKMVAERAGDWEAATRGDAFLARAFDFEAGEPFDRDKVVFLVREPGRIPFASVGWPGFVGVVSGMNREGVAIVVHGGRAGTPRNQGVPVVFSLRETLATAKTTEEAVKTLSSHEVMVSHITIVTDATGKTAVVERAPGVAAHVRWSTAALATTNHFEGPLANDARDAEVRAKTSTLPRRARGDVVVKGLPARPGVVSMVAALRDRKAPDGEGLPLGDRRAIDALIATHGVVMDTTERALWVSEYPHLLGRFVRFDLGFLLADGFDPKNDSTAEGGPGFAAVDADPILKDGTWDKHKSGK
jgi:isopenicillin-N N-acyltransferase-like protein